MSIYLGTSPIASTGYDKANTDLSNLTSTGKNIANWSNNVTNCITKIPQDIKLELNNGTLTLKAGSKVYVPNGFESDGTTPKFDEVVISNDITATYADGKTYVAYVVDGSRIGENNIETTVSGNTDTLTSWHLWYDTTNNIIKRFNNNNQVVDNKCSLPICVYLTDSSTITSIDQVFNGFGYIGSTIFALPGVKGLIPNGRNADGSLKNIEVTINKVYALTTSVISANMYISIANYVSKFVIWAHQNNAFYNEEDNSITYGTHSHTKGEINFVGTYTTDSNAKITSLTPKTAFHAVDYNDFNNTPHIVETYKNGTSWYRVYSDGWCEQGFCYSPPSSSAQTINLLKEYKDINYIVQTTYNTGSDWGNPLYVYNKTVNNFILTTRSTWNTSTVIAISVCGYIS